MPGRDPEARQRSQTVAAEIRAVLAEKGISHTGLRDLLAKAGVQVPNDMWVSRRLSGGVNLVEPVKVVYGPTDDLTKIAEVLGEDPRRFVRTLNKKPAAAKPAE